MPDARTCRLPAFVLALGLVLAALALAGPSTAAAKSCADDVISDWYGDGRVDKVFPLRCYQEAIRSLPVDVLDYSNAKQDILRALAFARKGKQDPGPSGSNETASVDEPEEPTAGTGNDTGSGKPPKAGTPDPVPTTPTPPRDAGTPSSAAGTVDTSGPSSLPIPLLILGGLALLLLAAGAIGYLNRRAHARREGGPPGPA